jgi:hypothetical protein
MAILNMILAAYLLICGFCVGSDVAIISAASPTAPGAGGVGSADFKATVDRESPGWAIILVAYSLMEILLAIILVVSGIGLLKMQNWARWLCLAYAALSFLLALTFTTYVLVVMQPAREHALERDMDRSGQTGASKAGFAVGKTVGTLTNIIGHGFLPVTYAITLGIVMLLPGVGRAFARAKRRPRFREDEDEDEDDRDADREHDAYDNRGRYADDDEYDDDWDDNRRRRRR